jgi:pyruvate,orthophosphate dikinase
MAAVLPPSAEYLGKLARIRQLAAHGLNTPRIALIEAGTPVDAALRERLRDLAAGDERMTVRTYHPADEIQHAKGPFLPEAPVEDAIEEATRLVSDWNVLFQEAIDVSDTVLAGNLLVTSTGRGRYELVEGRYRVRDVDDLPPGAEGHVRSGRFDSPEEIADARIQDAVERVLRSGLLEAVSPRIDDPVVLELNIQRRPVGMFQESLLWWEWRPLKALSGSKLQEAPAVAPGEFGSRVWSIGVPGLPEPPGDARGVLGGKGAGLLAALRAGLPVMPAFAIAPGDDLTGVGDDELAAAINLLLEGAQASFGRDPSQAKLAVRSSPIHSMPGMLDTCLDVAPTVAAVSSAVVKVLASWHSDRARLYRQMHGIADSFGLAVVVQQMVFPDADERSGSGVGFTRDPRTGGRKPLIEYVRGRRGTPLVSGRLDPSELADLSRELPEGKREIERWIPVLETVGGDVQEFEFAFERSRPFLLQMRPARQPSAARVLSAYDLWRDHRIDSARAAQLLEGLDLDRLERRRLRTQSDPLAEARVAAPGAAIGRIALDQHGIDHLRSGGDPVVLVVDSVTTDDYGAFRDIAGVLSSSGGVTSHAAVVALEAGVVALVGCEGLHVQSGSAEIGETHLEEGDWVSIDGGEEGRVFAGRLPIESADGDGENGLTDALAWAEKTRAII